MLIGVRLSIVHLCATAATAVSSTSVADQRSVTGNWAVAMLRGERIYRQAFALDVSDRFGFDDFTLVYLRNAEADSCR